MFLQPVRALRLQNKLIPRFPWSQPSGVSCGAGKYYLVFSSFIFFFFSAGSEIHFFNQDNPEPLGHYFIITLQTEIKSGVVHFPQLNKRWEFR